MFLRERLSREWTFRIISVSPQLFTVRAAQHKRRVIVDAGRPFTARRSGNIIAQCWRFRGTCRAPLESVLFSHLCVQGTKVDECCAPCESHCVASQSQYQLFANKAKKQVAVLEELIKGRIKSEMSLQFDGDKAHEYSPHNRHTCGNE